MTPAPVSGTSGQGTSVFTNQVVIDHAFLLCRMARQQISEEYILTAQEQLAMMLLSWANEGAPLWCQTKYILPLIQGVYSLDVSQYAPGVVDIQEANLRRINQLTGTTTTVVGLLGNTTTLMPAAIAVENVGIQSALTGNFNVSLQYSNDGVNWTTFYTNLSLSLTAGVFTWMDFQGLPVALYWRLQSNGSSQVSVSQLFFGNLAQEIQISRINKDDYWNLPNKTFQGRPVQYWCDRQAGGPVMQLWPAPGAAFAIQQITILAHRHIMDVGSMTQQIEAPQRAFDAIHTGLGARLRMVIPEVDKQKTADIPALAAAAKKLFWSEERDDSPINLQIDLSAYTS